MTFFGYGISNGEHPVRSTIKLGIGKVNVFDSVGKEGSRRTEQQAVFGDILIEGEVWYQTDSSGITYFANRSNGLWKRRRELFYVGPPGDLQEPELDVPSQSQ